MYSFNVGIYADLELVNYGYIYLDDLAPKHVTRAKYSLGRDVVQLTGFSPRTLASNPRADHVAVAVDTVTLGLVLSESLATTALCILLVAHRGED